MTYIVGEVSSPFGAHGRGAHDVRGLASLGLGASDFTPEEVAAVAASLPTTKSAAQVRIDAIAAARAKLRASGDAKARADAGKSPGKPAEKSNTTLIIAAAAAVGLALVLSNRKG